MKKIQTWLRKGAEGVTAALLAVMFFTFILQIASRYLLAEPFGWTLELCLTLWIWVVFFGCAFVVKHDDHVTFDVIYYGVRPKTRRIFALISAASIVIALGWSIYPTWDWIDFLKIKKSATLRIPMRDVYSIYAAFLVATVVAYGARFIMLARKGLPEENKDDHGGIKS